MKIAVILGRVLDPAGIVVNRQRGRIFVNREEYVMQPADRCALEAALQIKDGNEAEVVALPRGSLLDDDVLRQALSMGVDRAINFVGWIAEQPEGLPLSYSDAVATRLLVAAVERLGDVDLILTGATTLDTGQSQLGSRLAGALGWPQSVDVWAVRVVGDHVEVVCQAPSPPVGGDRGGSSGYIILETDLPAVVTVHPGALKPRYPDGVRLIDVYRDEGAVERWGVDELIGTDDLVPLLERRGQDFPPVRERGLRLEGAPQEMAEALAGELRKRVG